MVDMPTIFLVWIKYKVAKDVSSAIVLKQFTLASTVNSLLVGRKEKLGQLNVTKVFLVVLDKKETHLRFDFGDTISMVNIDSFFNNCFCNFFVKLSAFLH